MIEIKQGLIKKSSSVGADFIPCSNILAVSHAEKIKPKSPPTF
jgi:hypothetical protein